MTGETVLANECGKEFTRDPIPFEPASMNNFFLLTSYAQTYKP